MNNPTDQLELCLTALYTTGYTLLKCKGGSVESKTVNAVASLQPTINFVESLKETGYHFSPEILQIVVTLVDASIETAVSNS